MGKYILEVLVIVLVALFLAPFVLGGVNQIRKRYAKIVNETLKENDNDENSKTD